MPKELNTHKTRTTEILQGIFIYTSWLPVAISIGVYLYLQTLHGWGAFGVASTIITPIIVSSIYLVVGASLSLHNYNKNKPTKHLIFFTLLSGSTAILFILRVVQMNIYP